MRLQATPSPATLSIYIYTLTFIFSLPLSPFHLFQQRCCDVVLSKSYLKSLLVCARPRRGVGVTKGGLPSAPTGLDPAPCSVQPDVQLVHVCGMSKMYKVSKMTTNNRKCYNGGGITMIPPLDYDDTSSHHDTSSQTVRATYCTVGVDLSLKAHPSTYTLSWSLCTGRRRSDRAEKAVLLLSATTIKSVNAARRVSRSNLTHEPGPGPDGLVS